MFSKLYMLIGITGKMGTGKHTFAAFLQKYLPNTLVLDANHIAHDLYRPNTLIYNKIVAKFGNKILDSNKTINRQKLGQIVFADKQNLKSLSRIIHPALRAELEKKITIFKKEGKSIILIAAILPQLKIQAEIVIQLTAPEFALILRLQRRDGLRRAEIEQRLQQQTNIKKCDFIIINDGDLSKLENQASVVSQKLLSYPVTSQFKPQGIYSDANYIPLKI